MTETSKDFTALAVARELWLFIARPREMVAQRKADWSRPLSAAGVLAGCAGGFVAIWGLYGLAFGSLVENAMGAQSVQEPAPVTVATESQAAPVTILRWGVGLGVGLQFPELDRKSAATPQKGVFTCGMAYVVIDNVVPARLSGGAFPLLILGPSGDPGGDDSGADRRLSEAARLR